MTAYRAGVRDRSGPMKSVKIPDRSGELEPAMSDFFSRSHSSLHFCRPLRGLGNRHFGAPWWNR